MKTGDHILHLSAVGSMTFRAKCACGTAFVVQNGDEFSATMTREQASAVHRAHFDDANAREQAEREAQS